MTTKTKMKVTEFKTKDGLTLPGILYEAKNSNKVALFLHGNGSSSIFYDQNDNLDLPHELNKKGISLFKFNNRGAHIIKKLNVKVGDEIERKKYGCAYEIIKECVQDIDGAIKYLQDLGYSEFYLIGASTGANKICVYNYYKPINVFSKYILLCGGDDTGIYHSILGKEKFSKILSKSKKMIKKGQGEEIMKELLPDEIFSYKGFYDIADPDGDYNCFPFSEALGKAKLSTKPLFRYFKTIKTPSLVIYGENDEYAWGDVSKVINILKSYQPSFIYKIIKDADHGFTGKKNELARLISDWI
jgi:pimeloyl-ACP methyl ester carboxylesterase